MSTPTMIVMFAGLLLAGCPTTFAIAECRESCSKDKAGAYMIAYNQGSCVCGPLPDAVIDEMARQALDAGGMRRAEEGPTKEDVR